MGAACKAARVSGASPKRKVCVPQTFHFAPTQVAKTLKNSLMTLKLYQFNGIISTQEKI